MHTQIIIRRILGISLAAGAMLACRDLMAPNQGPKPGKPASYISGTGVIPIYPGHLQGWIFTDEVANTACTGATCQLTSGPSDRPYGTGTAELSATTTTSSVSLSLPDYRGVRFDSITSLDFFERRLSKPAILLQLKVDYDLNDTTTADQGTLTFQLAAEALCPSDLIPIAGKKAAQSALMTCGMFNHRYALLGTWKADSAHVYKSGAGFTNPCTAGCTWAQLHSNFPNLGIHPTLGFVKLKAGPSSPVVHGYVDGLTIGISGANTTFDFESAAPEMLIVYADPGIATSPIIGDTLISAGASVQYAFHDSTGRPIVVYRDSVAVADSGTIVMTTGHVLVARVLPDTVLRSDDLPLYDAIRAYLSAGSPHAAFQEVFNTVMLLRDAYPEAEADSSFARSVRAAIDPVLDSANLHRVDRALEGHLFDILTPEQILASRTPNGRRIGARSSAIIQRPGQKPSRVIKTPVGDEKNAVVFANGIQNTNVSGTIAYGKIWSLARQIGSLGDAGVTNYKYYYNPTVSDSGFFHSLSLHCLASLASSLATPLRTEIPDLNCKLGEYLLHNDFEEAIAQHVLNMVGLPLSDTVTNHLGDSIYKWRHFENRNVIIIPHSQGNLITSIALQYLHTIGALTRNGDTTCVSVVPLASPTTNFGTMPSRYIKPVQLAGDLILNAPGDKFPTSSSVLFTRVATRVTNMRGALLGTRVSWINQYAIHGVTTYADTNYGGGLLVKAAVAAAYNACKVVSVAITPVISDSIPWSTTLRTFTATAINGAGDTLHVTPKLSGDGTNGTTVDISEPGGKVISSQIRSVYSEMIFGVYSLPPVVSSLSCAKGAVTRDGVNIYTEYSASVSGSGPASPSAKIARYQFELQISQPGHADDWYPTDTGTRSSDGTLGTGGWSWHTWSQYADSEELEGLAKPNGHCRVRATDQFGKTSAFIYSTFTP